MAIYIGNHRIIPGAVCPECGAPVVYNGNYFCSELDYGNCNWAMDQNNPRRRPKADVEILRLAGVDAWGSKL